jgi:DNA-binding Lrp family transcriptional regulator
MTEEERTVEGEHAEAERRTVTEEVKIQARDLSEAINDLIREGTVRRITIVRNDRILLDIPLAVGAAAGVILAVYLPVISAIAGLGVLLSGATLRIEREEPPEGA